MAHPTSPLASAALPSPHRRRIGKTALAFALWAGPAAWLVQLVAGYGLALHPCFPGAIARTRILPGWDWDWPVLLGINVAAVMLALAGGALSVQHWRRTRREARGSSDHAIEVGEGRTRFLALCGMMTGFGFLVAIVFNTVALFVVPLCTG